MAILKHIASKNANYGSAIDYLKYQHDEFHLVPVLDESGNMLLREEFYLDGLNCNPETFDLECELLNQQHHKNNTYDEIKSHHYIISHDPRDNADHDLTGERAQAIGLECRILNFLHYPLWYQNQIVYAEDSIRWIAFLAQLVHKRWPPFWGSHLNDITVF